MAKRFSIKKLTAGVLALLMVVTALPVSGISASVKAADADTAEVYRSYNPNNGEHLLTVSKAEHDFVVGLGYNDEGKRFLVPTSSKTPIYRAYDPNSGEHLLVPEEEAKWLAETQGWDNEGIKMYADDDKSAGVYRVYNPNATNAGRHNYSNKEEADWLVAQGWVYDNDGEPVFYSLALLGGEVKEVFLDNVAPKVGDTITACAVSDDEGTLATNVKSYQWYRTDGTDELMIKGETGSSYTVTAGDINCSIYVVVEDTNGNKFYSKETSKVQQMVVSSLKITGMSKKATPTDKTENVAVIGDVLTAETNAEGAGEYLTYQWYRGENTAITGANESEYEVTADDVGHQIYVKIESINTNTVFVKSTAASANTENNICKDIATLTSSISKTSAKVGDTITLTLKDGDKNITSGIIYGWYREAVDNDHLMASEHTSSYTIDSADNGKVVYGAMMGNVSNNYVGTVVLSCSVGAQEISGLQLALDTGLSTQHTGTTGTATAGVGTAIIASFASTGTEDATATYTWEIDGKTVSTTGNTYVITAEDVGIDGTTPVSGIKVKVTAEGTGDYTGTDTVTLTLTQITAATDLVGFDVYDLSNPLSTKGVADDSSVYADHTYSVRTYPASAAGSVHATWVYDAASASNQKLEDSLTFTVPTDATAVSVYVYYEGDEEDNIAPGAAVHVDSTIDTGNTERITASGTANGSNAEDESKTYYLEYKKDGTAAVPSGAGRFADQGSFTVKKSLSEIAITFDNNKTMNKAATGYKTYDNPEVGIYAHARITPSVAASYQWVKYLTDPSDYEEIGAASTTAKDYEIQDSDIGYHLMCLAVASASGYENAQILSAPTEVVKASSRTLKEVYVVKSTDLTGITTAAKAAEKAVTELAEGKEYAVVVVDSTGAVNTDGSGLSFIWDGSAASSYLKDSQSWTAKSGVGTVTVKATPDGKNYTGDAVSYVFKTEVGSNSTPAVAGTITYEMGNGDIVEKADYDEISENDTLGVKTIEGVQAIKTIEWYEAPSATAAGKKIGSNITGDVLQANGITAPNYYFAIITDSADNVYTGARVKAVASEATSLSATTISKAKAGKSGVQVGTFRVLDQFGNTMPNGSTDSAKRAVYEGTSGETASSELTATGDNGEITVTQDSDGAAVGTYRIIVCGLTYTVTIADPVATYVGATASTTVANKTQAATSSASTASTGDGSINVTLTTSPANLYLYDQFGDLIYSLAAVDVESSVATSGNADATYETDADGKLTVKFGNNINTDSAIVTFAGLSITITVSYT